jgi:hypothetical protein
VRCLTSHSVLQYCSNNHWHCPFLGARSGTVGWGTALQAGRSQVWLLMVSLEFFSDIILLATLWPWDWLSLLTEMSTWNIFWEGKGGQGVWLTTLPPTCTDCLESWGTSTSWNPQDPSMPVMGLPPLQYLSDTYLQWGTFRQCLLHNVACLIFAPTVLTLACQPKVLSQSNVWVICGVKSGTWTGFLCVFGFVLSEPCLHSSPLSTVILATAVLVLK